jgi:two-component system, cell cycle response regulator DivK
MSKRPAEAAALIVEDNPDNLFIAIELLRRAGVSYYNGSPSGRQLFELLETIDRPIDLILLDLQIPEQDGYTILKLIRATPRLRGTRVVALTANVMADDLAKARAAGFDGLIGKPINKLRFARQIERILQGEAIWEPR